MDQNIIKTNSEALALPSLLEVNLMEAAQRGRGGRIYVPNGHDYLGTSYGCGELWILARLGQHLIGATNMTVKEIISAYDNEKNRGVGFGFGDNASFIDKRLEKFDYQELIKMDHPKSEGEFWNENTHIRQGKNYSLARIELGVELRKRRPSPMGRHLFRQVRKED